MIKSLPLGDVAKFVRGITFKPDDVCENFTKDSTVCMRTKNVQATIDTEDLISVPSSFVRRAEQKVQFGDLLVSSANSWNLVGKACWVPELSYETTAGGFISILRCNRNTVEPRYFYHWVTSGRTQHELRYCGRQTTNISNLDFDRALALPIPLPYKNGKPDLDEQKRIAAILDKADGIRRKRQQALRLTDDFLRSVFLDMFGDPVTNPKNLPKIALGDLLKVKSGSGLTAKNMAHNGTFPVYGGNGINGYHDKFLFEKRMITLGRVGAYCGAVHYTEPFSWITDNALYVEHMKCPMNAVFLVDSLRFANLNQYAGQVGQPLISGNRIYPVKILNPSIAQQDKYSEIVEKWQGNKEQNRSSSKHNENLFASLQQRAFRGEL